MGPLYNSRGNTSMTVKVTPMTPPVETSRWVDQYRFLAELHTPEQQLMLNIAHKEALGLSFAEETSTDPTLMSTNGFPVAALRAIAIAYEHMKALNSRVDLLSPGMTAFFQAAAACGVYGLDAETANAEIARIVSNETPAAA